MTDLQDAATNRPMPAYKRENVVALAAKLRGLRMRKLLQFTDLIDGAGFADKRNKPEMERVQQRFSRWVQNAEIGNKWKSLKPSEFDGIIKYLLKYPKLSAARDPLDLLTISKMNADQVGSIDNIFPDATFHSLASWFKMSEDAYEELWQDFCGTYIIYRHSRINLGHVFVGRLVISYDQNTKAVVTIEEYKANKSKTIIQHDSKLKGYMFRRDHRYRILSKDCGTDELQYIYINKIQRSGQRIIRMMGVVMDIEDGDPYTTRIGFLRVNEGDKVTLKTIPFDTAPSIVPFMIGEKPQLIGSGECIALFK